MGVVRSATKKKRVCVVVLRKVSFLLIIKLFEFQRVFKILAVDEVEEIRK